MWTYIGKYIIIMVNAKGIFINFEDWIFSFSIINPIIAGKIHHDVSSGWGFLLFGIEYYDFGD